VNVLDADVVVVGSGCTGGWASKVLTEAGCRVILLEAGRTLDAQDRPDRWYQDGDRRPAKDTSRHPVQKNHPAFCDANRALWIDDIDHPYVTDPQQPFVWIRARARGGRSNLWGGQCWRLTDHELNAPRADAFGESWPLDAASLRPHYEEVEAFQRVSGQRDDDPDMPDQIVDGNAHLTAAERRLVADLRAAGLRAPIAARSASDDREDDGWPRFSSLGSTLPAAQRTGRLHVIGDATVTHLTVDSGGRQVHAAHYLDAAGNERRIRARAFVLCASTIETTRILLQSRNPRHPDGLGNGSGALGRYLMDHIGTVAIGRVPVDGDAPATFFGGRHGLYFPRQRDTAAVPSFRRSYGCWLSLGRDLGHGQNAIVTAIGEMLPYAENRVVLDSARVDRHGLPVPRISCREHDNERAMRKHQHARVGELARLAGIELALGPNDVALGALVHEVGTARMGADPTTSYCNAVAQSWEVPNLFVPDGACWTTSAYQNPTLTMMAMSVRCSRFIAGRLLPPGA
jgi:choline dehydrogenase-like flavoprotein